MLTLQQAFWDATGGLWAKGALANKYAAVFVSTGTQGGGQGESFYHITLARHNLLTRTCRNHCD